MVCLLLPPQPPNLRLFTGRRHPNSTHPSIACLASPSPLSDDSSWEIHIFRGSPPAAALACTGELLAAVFTAEEDPPPSATQLLLYKARLMAALQLRGVVEGRQFTTVLSCANPSTPPSSLNGRDVAHTSGSVPAGVVTVGPGLPHAKDHVELPPGTTAASINNMAVAEPWRRKGVGRRLLAAAEEATGAWPCPPSLFSLCVHRSNAPAIKLYEGAGYRVDASWTDPQWLEDAERGRVGSERRLLMVKRVAACEEEEREGEELVFEGGAVRN